MAKANYPSNAEPDASLEEINRTSQFSMKLVGLPKVNYKNPQEIDDRCKLYMELCGQYGRRPFIEGLVGALGCHRQSFWDWSKEQSPRGEIVRKWKQAILIQLESWNVEGKINPVSGIFLLKNIGGYTDTYQLESSTQIGLKPSKSPEEIAREIEEDIPIDAEIIDL